MISRSRLQYSISDLAENVAAQDIDKKNMMRELREVKISAIRHERTLKRWMTKVRAAAKGHQANNEGSGYTKEVVGLERRNAVDRFVVFVITISRIQCDEDGTDIIARLRALEDKVGRQNDIIKLQATQINDLQETVTEQKQSISDLAEKLAAQDIDKKNMMRELREVKNNAIRHERTLKRWMTKVRAVAKGHQINNEGSGYTKEVVGLEQLNAVDNARKRFVLDSMETVAFEAIISGGTKLPHSHVNDRLVFETVSLNVGSSYHAGNGTFNAPVPGIYVFSTSVMMTTTNTNDPEMHVVIEKNGVEVAGAFAVNRGSYEHSSVTAVMELQAGDAVFVSVERHDDLTFYGDKLTSFMGFLLYPF